jgi:hypothetical protein
MGFEGIGRERVLGDKRCRIKSSRKPMIMDR